MVAMRAIAGGRPVHEPARHGPGRSDSAAGRAGFPAALKAAAEEVGGPASTDDPPQAQSDPLASRPLPSGRPAPAAVLALLAAAADSLDLPAVEGAGRTASGAARERASAAIGPAVPGEGDGDAGAAHRGGPQPTVPVQPSATAAPTVPPARAGAAPNGARLALPPHLAPIAGSLVRGPDKTVTEKTPSAPARGLPHPPEKEPSASPHRLPHREGAAVLAAAGIPAAAAAGASEMMIVASLPPARAADPVVGHPENRLSSHPPLPVDGSLPQRPILAGSRSDPGPDPGIAPGNAVAALPGKRGLDSDAPGAAGVVAPRTIPSGPPIPGATDAGGKTPGGSAPSAGGTGPAESSVSAPFAPQPRSAAAGVGEKPSVPTPLSAMAGAAAKPSPSSGGVPAPGRPLPHSPEPTVLPAGPIALGTSAPPAADAGAAAKPGPPAPASDALPPNLAGQLSGPIAGAIAGGHRDLSLHLHPPELGEVSIRLVVTGRAVSAWFDSPQPQVQQAIGQGMGELHADLAAAGYDLSGAWVGGQTWTPRERGGSPLAPRPARPAAAAPVQEVGRTAPAAAGSGVSVYV